MRKICARVLPRFVFAALLAVGFASTTQADQYGLEAGSVKLQSANVIAFGPAGILFVGDSKAARVVAVQTGDKPGDASKVQHNLENIEGKIASQLEVDKATVLDMAVNPLSGHLFVSVDTSKGPQVVMLDGSGAIVALQLNDIHHANLDLPNPPADEVVGEGRRARNHRMSTVTDLAFVDGQLLVSGMSAGPVSAVRSFMFPFNGKAEESGLEIYHGAHGQLESLAPIRTFVPFIIDGKPNVLAGFVCTPLVKFPVSAISENEKFRGTTIAELGNRNQPLDMIAYTKDGKDYLLLANSARGIMKISTEDIDKAEGIDSPVRGGGVAGQSYETIESWQNVVQLDRLNDKQAVVLVSADGQSTLKTMNLP
ncbi:MAG: hypothetical protein KDA88_08160 [Planctomycetaceae bacterium]|nr:hypothetical protein [Planctomycetaceae bacterium]MCB9950432.1 hypothetical protein [Planctomycetaceae bacterium]